MDRSFALLLPLALLAAGCVAPEPGAEAPPFRIEAGHDAGPDHTSPFVPAYALNADGFDARLIGVAGARLDIDSIARIVSTLPDPQTLLATLDAGGTDTRAALVDSAGVTRAVLTSAHPEAQFELEPGAVLDLSWTFVTAEDPEGAGSVARFRLATFA